MRGTQPRTCNCGNEFTPYPGKPGLITECPTCGQKNKRNPELLMAKVSWEGKHTPIIEVAACARDARNFNAAQRRRSSAPIAGFGVGANGSHHSTDWGDDKFSSRE